MLNYLPLVIRRVLQETGWTENEINIYSKLLEKGMMNLSDIAQETGVAVSTCQYSIKQLLSKRMLHKNMVNGKPRYAVSNIDTLKVWFKNYMNQFAKYEDAISSFVEQYDFDPQSFTSKVKFYTGYKGLKASYQQILKDCTVKEMSAVFTMDISICPEIYDFLETL